VCWAVFLTNRALLCMTLLTLLTVSRIRLTLFCNLHEPEFLGDVWADAADEGVGAFVGLFHG